MHKGKRHLNQKLPSAPAPHCGKCKSSMPTVKILNQATSTAGVVLTCTASCPQCKASHIGKRTILVKGMHMSFAGQTFDLVPGAGDIPGWMKKLAFAALAVATVGLGYWIQR